MDTARGIEDTHAFDLTRMPAERLLVLVGGVSAIGFGGLALVLYIVGADVPRFGAPFAGLGGAILGFTVALTFGLALLLASARMDARPAEGGILALAFSIVLLAFGGFPGVLAGILGLVGALTALVRNIKFAA